MARVIRKSVGIAVAVAGGVLAGGLVGFVPGIYHPRPSERPFDAELAVTPAEALHERDASVLAEAETAVVQRLPIAALCEAPTYGSTLRTLKLVDDGEENVVVWCRGGYAMFAVRELATSAPRVEQLAFFRTRADAPGGVAAGDFDADGVPDLALGVAPRPPLVHRSGAGVFWLRGRLGGGFEAPRPLVETPTMAVYAQKRSKGHALWVLTRGEPAAQRPGELWAFAPANPPSRALVVPGVVDPRDWLFVPHGEADTDVWIVSGDPGALVRVGVRESGELVERRHTVPLRGAQEWVAGSSPERALVRDGASLVRLDVRATEPVLSPFAEQVRVGPASLIDLDGDARGEVVCALPEGAAVVDEAGQVADMHLPTGLSILAATVLHDGTGKAHAALLAREAHSDKLALLFPGPVSGEKSASQLLEPLPVTQSSLPVQIALE